MNLSYKVSKYNKKICYSEAAKFRNAEYKLCNFSELKIINNPKLKIDKEEGYSFSKTGVRFPIISSENPYDVYSNTCIGYTEPISINFAAYDKKLHQQYRLYESKKDYDAINVFDNKIYFVDLHRSIISLSKIGDIRFDTCNMNNVIINEVHFEKAEFLKTKISYSLIENCIFDQVRVLNEFPSRFIHTIFVNVEFYDTSFERTRFIDCTFIGCIFHSPNFSRCHIASSFIDCEFINFKSFACTTPSAQSFNFDLNYFKALCRNCTFE